MPYVASESRCYEIKVVLRAFLAKVSNAINAII